MRKRVFMNCTVDPTTRQRVDAICGLASRSKVVEHLILKGLDALEAEKKTATSGVL